MLFFLFRRLDRRVPYYVLTFAILMEAFTVSFPILPIDAVPESEFRSRSRGYTDVAQETFEADHRLRHARHTRPNEQKEQKPTAKILMEHLKPKEQKPTAKISMEHPKPKSTVKETLRCNKTLPTPKPSTVPPEKVPVVIKNTLTLGSFDTPNEMNTGTVRNNLHATPAAMDIIKKLSTNLYISTSDLKLTTNPYSSKKVLQSPPKPHGIRKDTKARPERHGQETTSESDHKLRVSNKPAKASDNKPAKASDNKPAKASDNEAAPYHASGSSEAPIHPREVRSTQDHEKSIIDLLRSKMSFPSDFNGPQRCDADELYPKLPSLERSPLKEPPLAPLPPIKTPTLWSYMALANPNLFVKWIRTSFASRRRRRNVHMTWNYITPKKIRSPSFNAQQTKAPTMEDVLLGKPRPGEIDLSRLRIIRVEPLNTRTKAPTMKDVLLGKPRTWEIDLSRLRIKREVPLNTQNPKVSRSAPRTLYQVKPLETVTTEHWHNKTQEFWKYNVYPISMRSPQVVTKITIRDNHKPVFRDCFKYKPTVPEEAPIGTEVLRVEAFDPDPPQSGGAIVYQFVSTAGEKERFTIDPSLGVIRTADIFDRDEPSREKEIYITVRASDNGQPSLDDACTIKIIITDINDNAPVFDKVAYTEAIPQDTAVGREIMRISATDIDDGANSVVHYHFDAESPDNEYFTIEGDTGIIRLNKTLDKPVHHKFRLNVIVTDSGDPVQQSSIALDITVVDSSKKPPMFTELPVTPLMIPEDYAEYSKPIAILRATSNVPNDDKVQFELVQGQTEQTNKLHTFVLEPEVNSAIIKLGGHLDFETITEYTLTVRIQNSNKLAAEVVLPVDILDVNDNIPVFKDAASTAIVMENEPAGTVVMRAQAIDNDATAPNNEVFYLLENANMTKSPFAIDRTSGVITTTRELDREKMNSHSIKIIAIDGAESSLLKNGEPNTGSHYYIIDVADRNDNPPHFGWDTYVAESIAENANVNELVTIVTAHDVDTGSLITYSIVNGNIGDAFKISPTTGEIRVNKELDYEKISNYQLEIRAFDGIYEDYCKVIVNIENLNDNPPVFVANYTKVIEEEKLYPGCIVKVEAYDPDISDRNAPQDIAYSIVKTEQNEFLDIDDDGCLRLTKPLNRDQPTGFIQWQILIMAVDQGGRLGSDSLRSTTEVIVELTDVNDNAPFLTNKQPIVVYENEPPHHVANLTARDYDSPENGPPFTYYINDTSEYQVRHKFAIQGDKLYTLLALDREAFMGKRKNFMIPIMIADSGTPRMSGLSLLSVIIGDRNDNPMGPGFMSVLAYKLENKSRDMEIGRVYVEDLDDWDLPDKNFTWAPTSEYQSGYFDLNYGTGMITLKPETSAGSYELKFKVSEENLPNIPFHTVESTVNVTVKVLPEEAIRKSGSIRFINITAEQFIEKERDGFSKKEKLQMRLAKLHNVSVDNVDIFAIFNKKTVNSDYMDLRYTVHNSPYYEKEKLDFKAGSIIGKIEDDLGVKIDMIGIDECANEREQCEGSCRTVLTISNVPLQVFTNTTSFVGISAKTESECTCDAFQIEGEPLCKNGGTQVGDRCECPPGYFGPKCERTTMSFLGDSWAMFPGIPACSELHISFDLVSHKTDTLVFYAGPTYYNPNHPIPDHMAFYLQGGYPTLLVNHGSGTTRLNSSMIDISNSKSHLIEMTFTTSTIEMFVDKCKLTSCMSLAAPAGNMKILNILGPLILGGLSFDVKAVSTAFGWSLTPPSISLSGCISNFTINGNMLDMGTAKWEHHTSDSCLHSISTAVSFGIDNNFLIAIVACLVILIILLLAVVVHRHRADAWHVKELDDIRENIIAYEDEGGGEGDAGYDLQVLRQMYDGPPPDNDGFMHPAEGLTEASAARPRIPSAETRRDRSSNDIEMEEIITGLPSLSKIPTHPKPLTVPSLTEPEHIHFLAPIPNPSSSAITPITRQPRRSGGRATKLSGTHAYNCQKLYCSIPSTVPTIASPPQENLYYLPRSFGPFVIEPEEMMDPPPSRVIEKRWDPHDYILRRSVSVNYIYYEHQPLVKTDYERRRNPEAVGRWIHGPIVNPNGNPVIRRGPPRRSRSGLLSSVPDISGFLDGKKDMMDREVPEMAPFDDCRHYGYEGDGNSSGSLSSLASCTDDEDLKFNYLSTFGPRFRKLADMYGDTEEDRAPHEESWC